MQTSLVSLIQQHRPRRALLTSYTFSVSWFETFALPALMRNGCEQIDLLIDCRRANDSTQEAASQYAGSAYRVIPVPMTGRGIFHPKIAYFEGSETQAFDTLLIGSGNLTHAGQGKNLEIFDGVIHDRHPHVFGEFADFLTELQARYQFSTDNAKAIKHFEVRARLKGKSDLPADHESRTTWLIHTLNRPASRQLADLAMGTLENPEFLRVLAPYHAPSGGPVAHLAHEIGVTDISIALSGHRHVAPFRVDGLELPDDVKYVIPVTANSDRFAHAKHFEIRSAESSLLMTGSVNATVQSLETCKNVEISLVRKVRASMLDWEEVAPTTFEPCDFRDETTTEDQHALQASWTSTNWVEGSLAPAKAARTMDLSIWDGDARIALHAAINVAADGAFKVRMTSVPNTEDALVIQLEDSQLCARGWLNMEYALGGSLADRSLLRSANKLLLGDYSEEELKALFAWMENLLARNASRGSSGTKKTGNGEKTGKANLSRIMTPDDYEEWLREAVTDNYGASTVNAARISMAAAYAWLNRDLPPPADDQATATKAESESKTKRSLGSDINLLDTAKSEFRPNDSSANKREQANLKGDELYNKLLENVPRALERDNSSAMAAIVVTLSAGQALKRTLASPLPYTGVDRSDPRYITRRASEFWLTKYSKLSYSQRNRDGLMSIFCALACTTLHCNPDTPPEMLNEAIQVLAQRFVPAEEIRASARLGLSSTGFRRVPATDWDAIAGMADRIANAMTATHQLTTLLKDLFIHGVSSTQVPHAYAAAFVDLKSRAKNTRLGDKKFAVVQSSDQSNPHCPVCNCRIDTDDMRSLQVNRYFKCLDPRCQTPLFFGLNATELNELGLRGHFRVT